MFFTKILNKMVKSATFIRRYLENQAMANSVKHIFVVRMIRRVDSYMCGLCQSKMKKVDFFHLGLKKYICRHFFDSAGLQICFLDLFHIYQPFSIWGSHHCNFITELSQGELSLIIYHWIANRWSSPEERECSQ